VGYYEQRSLGTRKGEPSSGNISRAIGDTS
jgi:hypothetical protein